MRNLIIAAICMARITLAWAEPVKVASPAAQIKLEFGKSLISFSPTPNMSRQVEKVSVVGYEPRVIAYHGSDTRTPVKTNPSVNKQPNVYVRGK